jgi:predicted outer membrane protein
MRDFASHMIEQHTTSKQAAAQLAGQTGLKPADSPSAKELKQASDKTLAELNAADANNFDITYLDGQLEQHAAVLKRSRSSSCLP